MSKKIGSYFPVLILALLLLPLAARSADVRADLDAADKAYGEEQYTRAMGLYESVYAEGYFTETMLYRLAFMHEQLENYPQAIYYLKKAAQEFGNPDADAKIKQMMQTQGSTRIFTSDFWDAYFLFFNSYGLVIWLLFCVLAAVLAAEFLLVRQRRKSFHMVGTIGGWVLFVICGLVLFHYNFLTPSRAVITDDTSYYDFPGYAGNTAERVFSPGETVHIVDEEDIWVRVEAGNRVWWVPRHAVREL